MENDILFDKVHQLVILFQDSEEEIQDREKLLQQSNKQLLPVQRKLMQIITKFIQRLDGVLTKYNFGPDITKNVSSEIQTLFKMLMPYDELNDTMADVYDKYHEESYDDMIENMEKELVNDIAARFASDDVSPLVYEKLPLLDGPTIFDLRNFERGVAQQILEQNIDENAPEPIDTMYQLPENERLIRFDESYRLMTTALLSELRRMESLEQVREEMNDIVTFDKYSNTTFQAKDDFISVVRKALESDNLTEEEMGAIVNAMVQFENTLENEKSTLSLFSKYDLIDDFVTLEGRDPESGTYKTKFDFLHEAVDLLKRNSEGIERAMKQIRSREDIIVFFSNMEEE